MKTAWLILWTFACCGLNLLIPQVRQSGWAKCVIALIVLNELRGLYVVYLTYDKVLPWAL